MTSTPTRRAFLTTGAALTATAAAPLALAASPDPDRTLRVLVEAYHDAAKAQEAASEAMWSALDAMHETPAPEIPAALYFGGDDFALGFRAPQPHRGWKPGDAVAYTAGDVKAFRAEPRRRRIERPMTDAETAQGGWSPGETVATLAPCPLAQARADEIVAAWDALQAAHEARRQAFDLPRLEHEDRAASEAHRAAWKALAGTPAGTMAGVILKARVVAGIYNGSDDFDRWVDRAETTDEALAASIVLDLARLAPSA